MKNKFLSLALLVSLTSISSSALAMEGKNPGVDASAALKESLLAPATSVAPDASKDSDSGASARSHSPAGAAGCGRSPLRGQSGLRGALGSPDGAAAEPGSRPEDSKFVTADELNLVLLALKDEGRKQAKEMEEKFAAASGAGEHTDELLKLAGDARRCDRVAGELAELTDRVNRFRTITLPSGKAINVSGSPATVDALKSLVPVGDDSGLLPVTLSGSYDDNNLALANYAVPAVVVPEAVASAADGVTMPERQVDALTVAAAAAAGGVAVALAPRLFQAIGNR